MKSDLERTRDSWRGMKERCDNTDNKDYRHYGGRGINYTGRWDTLQGFIAEMGLRPQGKELDRINNDGPYTKENCRWISHEENSQKTRHCKLTAEKVRLIKAILRSIKPGTSNGGANWVIGAVFGVSESTIQAIKTQRTWSNIS